MADIAAANIAVDSSQIEQANARLREMPPAASAAEKAVKKYSATTMNAANSNEQFSKRTNAAIKSLEFERAQLLRSSTEREKYNALRKAGVASASKEGQAIAASVAALQAQRAALQQTSVEAKVATSGYGLLTRALAPLAAAFSIEALISKFSEALREVADLGETADQIGITVEGLQALQFQAVQNGISLEQLNTGIGKFSENIGKAAEGDKSMIESLQGLKVKILDVHGNLLPTENLLVQVAKRITEISDPARQTAAAVDFFGKAGKSLIPTLKEIAKGFDAMSADAKAAGAIISAEAIAKLDALADSGAKTHLIIRALFAENAAGPLTSALDLVGVALTRLSVLASTVRTDVVALLAFIANPGGAIGSALTTKSPAESIAANIAAREKDIAGYQRSLAAGDLGARGQATQRTKLAQAQAELAALRQQQQVIAVGGKAVAPSGDPDNIGIVVNLPPKGVRDPIIKGGAAGGAKSDPYKSAVQSAREYILAKNAETAAVGLSAEAAARMTHEQALLNKVQGDGKVATAAQRVEIANLAQQMAEADAKLATAKFMDDRLKKAEEFIASQKIEQEALFMSAQAAMAYKFEQEALNRAKADGIILTDQEKQKLAELANAQAAVQQKTNDMKDAISFAKDVTKGFFDDIRQGAEEGKSALEIFGNAFLNVLDKIASKLMDMAINDLFSGGNSSGGFFSAIGSILSNVLGSAVGSANGNVFDRGNVIPFARGGIVGGPTVFPMARGIGLMGEAGPEAIMPLRRGRNGSLGVAAHGGGGGSQPVVVYVTGDTDLVRVTSNQEAVKVVTAAAPKIEAGAVSKSTKAVPSAVATDHAERGGDYRT